LRNLNDLDALEKQTDIIAEHLRSISESEIDLDEPEERLDRVLAKLDQVKSSSLKTWSKPFLRSNQSALASLIFFPPTSSIKTAMKNKGKVVR
jgi:hypothetical protein